MRIIQFCFNSRRPLTQKGFEQALLRPNGLLKYDIFLMSRHKMAYAFQFPNETETKKNNYVKIKRFFNKRPLSTDK